MTAINETIKLYETESYKTEHVSKLLAIDVKNLALALDSTIFFPTGGGQDHDLGSINGLRVVDVYEKDAVVWHVLDQSQDFRTVSDEVLISPLGRLRLGEEVRSSIDFERRYDHMVQHSAEHIVSGIVLSEFGFKSTGFHIGSPYVRVDYSGYLDEDMLDKVLIKANQAVEAAHEINIYKGSYEELEDLKYRSKKELDGLIRIVDCKVDVCACCATHVRNTSEVRLITVVSNEKYKGGSRLMLLAGNRALEHVRKLSRITNKLSVILSSKVEDLVEAAYLVKEKAAELDLVNYRLEKRLADEIFEAHPQNQKRVYLEENFSSKVMNSLITRLCESYGGLFVGLVYVEDDFNFTVADSEEKAEDLAKTLFGDFGLKGGGRGKLYQGKFKASKEEVERKLKSIIK